MAKEKGPAWFLRAIEKFGEGIATTLTKRGRARKKAAPRVRRDPGGQDKRRPRKAKELRKTRKRRGKRQLRKGMKKQ